MNHHGAKRLMIAGLVVILAAILANLALGGTGGLIWIALVASGTIACLIALVFFIMHPVRRRN